jgi:hypothetical protein
MRPSVPDVHITDAGDADLAEYQTIAPQAVIGMLCGFLAPLALVDPLLWAFPIFGVIFSWWALCRIKAGSPAIAGRKMALTGWTLSVLFLIAAPADWMVYRYLVAKEAKQVADQWFQFITHDEPHKACQLTSAPQARQPLNDRLWDYYRNAPKPREQLEGYVKSPLVRTMLALGPKAQVRFYGVADQSRTGSTDVVGLWYAVTYEEQNERKSFFVLVRASRTVLQSGESEWRILETEGGVRPSGW